MTRRLLTGTSDWEFMLGRQETSSQIGKISESGIGVPLQFDDFATPACNEAMNAAELQSEWKTDTPVWDETPSTSSGQRGLASPEKHVDQRGVYSMDIDQGEVSKILFVILIQL
ncbi:hypothetical protein AVEN_206522-1 [Araneus ventricosus]|uniref:Uncharacterized protein n=1 Tax=Araneus ventricosus TaxID=182803 RepID=A0A4Y2PPR8_ARAVE|nr:hypothetical protein AVEN_206522-1 [Araneus ventricosus]